MKKISLTLAAFMAALITTLFAVTASAQLPCSKCGQLSGDTAIEKCMEDCIPDGTSPTTTATATPTATPTATATRTRTNTGTGTTTDTGSSDGEDPECKEHEEIKDGECICVAGYERFPAEDGPCVPECAEGQVRNADGECVDCAPAADPCCETLKQALADYQRKAEDQRAALDAKSGFNRWLLLANFLLLVILLGWRWKESKPNDDK